MTAKVTASLSVQRLDIKFVQRSNPFDTYEDIAKWHSIKSDVSVSVLENKSAVAYVDNWNSCVDFELPYEITLASWTEQKGSCRYSMVSSNSWNEWDIREMVSGLEFDESEMWFHLVPLFHGNVENRQQIVDPDIFFELFSDQKSDFECFGTSERFQDELMWRNPSWSAVPNVLSVLKESCSSLQVDCVIIDDLPISNQTSQGSSCNLM